MIRVTPAPEPATFHEAVRLPGLRAIDELVGEHHKRRGRRRKAVADLRNEIPADDFPDFWTKALDDLKTSYNHICAYSCFRIHEVTGAASVDHMVAKSKAWDRVYEWSNYRLACSLMNTRKGTFGDVLDPFDISDDWFHLELVGFQVLPNWALEHDRLRERIQDTINRLGLNDFCKRRAERAEMYWEGEISLVQLERETPFVARELRRQNQLLPGDG